MDDDAIIREFTHQAEAFDASPALRAAGTLGRLVDALPAVDGGRWLDAACGSGLVARALAPRATSVHGVDLTPSMLELARREAAREGLENVELSLGDVTSLAFADGSFDGAVTRFSLHHIPLPGRVVAELARVVRPGGVVAVSDHLTSEDAAVAAWHQEIERLRDPTHWACLTAPQLARLGERAGLTLERTETWPFPLDFREWLGRGSGGPGSERLIAEALAERDPGPPVFRVDADGTLQLLYTVAIWRRDE